ncbi:hypothetical protein Y032_0018g3725 [Ancylostoma ceylanicum]|nr:hypothetical protein Y032_0018g3725 [Ancylostoma ceylanicum]
MKRTYHWKRKWETSVGAGFIINKKIASKATDVIIHSSRIPTMKLDNWHTTRKNQHIRFPPQLCCSGKYFWMGLHAVRAKNAVLLEMFQFLS